MELTCNTCATPLSVPDDKLPKDVDVVQARCPKCQGPIEIRLKKEGPATAPASAAAPPPAVAPPSPAAPPPATAPAPAAAPAPMASPPPALAMPDEEFVGDRPLAMACFDQMESRSAVKAALEAAGYTVHVPAKAEEAVLRLRRQKYEVVILHEEFGGAADGNLLLKTLQQMAMPQRRHMCVGLVGKALRTSDNMTAFAKSVHFVVAEHDLGKINAVAKLAVASNDQFYRTFREALQEAGK